MENSRFDIPLWESEGEAIEPVVLGQNGAEQFERAEPEEERLEPISLNRERAAGLGRLAVSAEASETEKQPGRMTQVLRAQREKLRNLSDRDLMRGVGAVAGAVTIGAFAAPAHPIIGAGALAVAGAKLAEKAYEKLEDEYQRAQERDRKRYYRELEDYDKAFKNNRK